MIPFRKKRSGRIVASFTPPEAELLSILAVQVTELLTGVSGADDEIVPGLVIGGSSTAPEDPALARLLPDAYGDRDQSREFRELTEHGLAARKAGNARAIVEALRGSGDEIELDSAGALAWMQSITDIRLTLAVRLGIETEESVLPDDDETLAMLEVYDWLAGVQDSLVRALS